MNYATQRDFEAFLAGPQGPARLDWIARAGRIFTPAEVAELRRRLEDFFCVPAGNKTPGRLILEQFWADDK